MTKKDKTPTVVGGINLSTRFKSKTFWVASVSALAVFINQLTGAFGLDYSSQVEQGVNIIGSILTLLAGLGILVDNNTKGIKDSIIVQTDYHEPRDSKDPEQSLTWENNKVNSIVDGGSHPMAPDVVGELEHEDILAIAEPMEKLDSETPIDDVPDEHKTSSPKG